MIIFLLGFPIIIFAILEGTIVQFPFVLLFILSWAAVSFESSPLVTSFLAGLVVDLITLRPLGTTALFFLVCNFLFILYRRKYTASHLTFFVPASIICVLGYQYIFLRNIGLELLVLAIVFSIIIRFYIIQIFLRFGKPDQMILGI